MVNVKTIDGYLLRFFVIGFTKKAAHQKKKHSYAQSMQIKKIRAINTHLGKCGRCNLGFVCRSPDIALHLGKLDRFENADDFLRRKIVNRLTIRPIKPMTRTSL